MADEHSRNEDSTSDYMQIMPFDLTDISTMLETVAASLAKRGASSGRSVDTTQPSSSDSVRHMIIHQNAF